MNICIQNKKKLPNNLIAPLFDELLIIYFLQKFKNVSGNHLNLFEKHV